MDVGMWVYLSDKPGDDVFVKILGALLLISL
jgi:hypothetical protein